MDVSSWKVVVDAHTENILSVESSIRRDRQAPVYEWNPVVSEASVAFLDSLSPGASQLDTEDLVARNCLDPGICVPDGETYMHACVPTATAIADANGDFLAYERPLDDTAVSDTFAEVQVYYHAAKAYAAFRGWLGDASLRLFGQPLTLVANVQKPAVCENPEDATWAVYPRTGQVSIDAWGDENAAGYLYDAMTQLSTQAGKDLRLKNSGKIPCTFSLLPVRTPTMAPKALNATATARASADQHHQVSVFMSFA
jgi:hypothetical protein